jgi:hypothetical protein
VLPFHSILLILYFASAVNCVMLLGIASATLNPIGSSGFWLNAARTTPPLAQAVAEFLGPEAIGLLHIMPLIRHAPQALGATPAVDRSNKNSS